MAWWTSSPSSTPGRPGRRRGRSTTTRATSRRYSVPGSKAGESARIQGPTTSRIQRHEIVTDTSAGNFSSSALIPAPPPAPARLPRSLGDHSTACAAEIAAVAAAHFCPSEKNLYRTRRGMVELLGHLAGFPGRTWQERWQASGHDAGGRPLAGVAGGDLNLRGQLNVALGHAFAMRLIRPGLLGFRASTFTRYTPWFRSVAQDPWLEEFCDRGDRAPVSHGRRA